VYIQSALTFDATAGTTYYIAVDGWGGAVGNVVLNVNPPANDDFNTAFTLDGTSGSTNGYTLGASKEPREPAHAGDVGGHSIWYNWVAPMSGWVDFNTVGSTFDTTLAVYTGGESNPDGSLTNLAAVASNNDDVESEGALTSRVDFFAEAGTTYEIAIDGFGGVPGNTTLNWNMEVALGISSLPGGNVEIALKGVDWQRYTLLESSDFTAWATNTPTITMSGGWHYYTNSTATNALPPWRFFRAVQAP
jgi:hypothetical protein